MKFSIDISLIQFGMDGKLSLLDLKNSTAIINDDMEEKCQR